MSDWKENAIKRRNFRSVRGEPEKPGTLRSKKVHRPYIVLSRFDPKFYTKNKDSWYISQERRKNNNQWMKIDAFSSATGAQQAVAHWERQNRRWTENHGRWQYKIICTEET